MLLAAGVVLLALAFPPVDLGVLGFVGLVPIVIALHGSEGKRIYLLAYGAGVALFLSACTWLAEPALINLLGMALPEGLVFPLFVLFYRFGVRRARLPVWACTPIAWIAAEYIRATFPLDGFPWLLLGYTSWRLGPILQTADLFGVWGPGFLMALASGVIAGYAIAWKSDRQGSRRLSRHAGGVLWLVLLVAALVYGSLRPSTIVLEKGPVVATVQGNIPQVLKHNPNSAGDVLKRYIDGTRDLFEKRNHAAIDLVVWPETMYPYPVSDGAEGEIWEPERQIGDKEARQLERTALLDPVVGRITGPAGAWFLVGALTYRLGDDQEPERRNSVILYDTDGKRRSSYSKSVLVPGGEYLPWINSLPFGDEIESMIVSIAGFVPDLEAGVGATLHTLETRSGAIAFGVQICFENIYGNYCREFVSQGAQFMVNTSNEGWFRDSAEFDQMMAMSLFRAVETRRSLFRSTNTGISCLVDPLGTLPAAGTRVVRNGRDREVSGVLVVEVPLCAERTLFTAIGDLFPRILLLVQFAIVLFSILRRLWLQKTPAAIEGMEKK